MMPSASFSGGFGEASVGNEPVTMTAVNRERKFPCIKDHQQMFVAENFGFPAPGSSKRYSSDRAKPVQSNFNSFYHA
jgi:hypothetical protein